MKKIDNLKIEPVVNANDFIGISINNGQITYAPNKIVDKNIEL